MRISLAVLAPAIRPVLQLTARAASSMPALRVLAAPAAPRLIQHLQIATCTLVAGAALSQLGARTGLPPVRLTAASVVAAKPKVQLPKKKGEQASVCANGKNAEK